MKIVTVKTKQFLAIVCMHLLNITSKDIQEQVHVSKSVVSRYILGVRESQEIDLFIIERAYGIKITGFEIVG